uniref:Uncharacterized protein n=1 Tax=Engystomops pustulosus TaxID=76066 RepID=A0AAV6YKL2_ENGPU|nr:hypothetical protein GDO81_028452 [Engystomops pustulosus]
MTSQSQSFEISIRGFSTLGVFHKTEQKWTRTLTDLHHVNNARGFRATCWLWVKPHREMLLNGIWDVGVTSSILHVHLEVLYYSSGCQHHQGLFPSLRSLWVVTVLKVCCQKHEEKVVKPQPLIYFQLLLHLKLSG